MTNYFDDDEFWDGPGSGFDRTSQIERIRGRSPERTRSHHVVSREHHLQPLDDETTMWLEPAPKIIERLGPLRSVDPRVLSIGAVAVAVVLAVPLFSAFGSDGSGGDALRAVDTQSTTTVLSGEQTTPAADVVVVTAATEDDRTGDPDIDDSGDPDDTGTDGDGATPPVPEPQPETPAPAETEADVAELADDPDCANRYEAAAGDYWLRIAEGADTSLDSLLEVNAATAETPIFPGSTICLPADATAPAGFATLDDDGAGSAVVMAAAPETCTNRYETAAGDYWLRIANGAGIDLEELLELNGATADTPLYPGNEVCLPAGASGPSASSAPPTAAPTTAAATTAPPSTAPETTAATTSQPATTEAETTVPPAPPAPGEIEQIIRDAWPDELEEQALRIAWRESSYNPRAQNFCCSGLFQIYYDVHAGWLGDLGVNAVEDLYDPALNAKAAYALYQRSGSWEPWRMTAD